MKESKAQALYLREQKKRRRRVAAVRLLIFVGFLILWEAAARLGWIDSFIFSSPRDLASTFLQMSAGQSLITHIAVTLGETLLSFLLVIFFSLAAAVALWLFPGFARVSEPYMVVLNSLPKSALAPLLIVWLGANMRTIIVAGMSVALFGSIMNLYAGFRATDPDMLKLIRTLGGGKGACLVKVVLPSSVPYLLSTFKVNIGLCLVGVVIGEFIGARKGLGYLIIYGSQVFKLHMVILSIVILCVIATALYALLGLLEKRYLREPKG